MDDIVEKPSVRRPTELAAGQRLGKYCLEKRLGTGGSCEVWEARDCVEDISVALKIPLVGVGGERDSEQLFREVRLVARLRHPHIMSVKNADVIDGHAVLATELSVGTLEDRSRPMSVRRILTIVMQVLDGLAYAHRHRVVHCDVTPNNIFLFPDGRAALGDFGISLRVKGRMETVDEFGTPGYVAPEQAYGKPTYRSDCFAVALILYEYLTGVLPRWPFRWPPRGYQRLRERTTLAMVAFLKRALSVDPERRFADAGAMRAALADAVPRSFQPGLAQGPPPCIYQAVRQSLARTVSVRRLRRADCRDDVTMPVVRQRAEPVRPEHTVQSRVPAVPQWGVAGMALLPLVLRPRFQIAQHDAHQRRAVSQPLQSLRGQAHAVHAVLSVVSAQGAQAVAGQTLPRALRPVQLVGGFGVLGLLPVVPAMPGEIAIRKGCVR